MKSKKILLIASSLLLIAMLIFLIYTRIRVPASPPLQIRPERDSIGQIKLRCNKSEPIIYIDSSYIDSNFIEVTVYAKKTKPNPLKENDRNLLQSNEKKETISNPPPQHLSVLDTLIKKLSATRPDKKQVIELENKNLVTDEETIPPQFPTLERYIKKKLKYPPSAENTGIEGRVIIAATISEEGKVVNTKIIKSLRYDFDEEALNLIKKMPKWNPGILNGKPSNVEIQIPISFALNY